MSQKVENAKSLYLDGIRDGNARAAVEKYTGARYTQHSTGVRDGVEGFVEFFEPFIERNPVRDIQIKRAFDDGQYVFVHAYQSLNHGETEWVTMDFFDTDNEDRIIEHWDVIAAFEGENQSGRTQVDGQITIEDASETEPNKQLVRSMIEQLLMPGRQLDKAELYIHQDLIQHSLALPDGLNAFVAQLSNDENPIWYRDIVLLVGNGNFVATLSRVSRGADEYAQTDLYRIESGRIKEHWEASEPVPPKSELVNGGKF